ncbi:MAG: hypothetical protein V2A72_07530, partial [Candidatus Omnitrophota bacterium]
MAERILYILGRPARETGFVCFKAYVNISEKQEGQLPGQRKNDAITVLGEQRLVELFIFSEPLPLDFAKFFAGLNIKRYPLAFKYWSEYIIITKETNANLIGVLSGADFEKQQTTVQGSMLEESLFKKSAEYAYEFLPGHIYRLSKQDVDIFIKQGLDKIQNRINDAQQGGAAVDLVELNAMLEEGLPKQGAHIAPSLIQIPDIRRGTLSYMLFVETYQGLMYPIILTAEKAPESVNYWYDEILELNRINGLVLSLSNIDRKLLPYLLTYSSNSESVIKNYTKLAGYKNEAKFLSAVKMIAEKSKWVSWQKGKPLVGEKINPWGITDAFVLQGQGGLQPPKLDLLLPSLSAADLTIFEFIKVFYPKEEQAAKLEEVTTLLKDKAIYKEGFHDVKKLKFNQVMESASDIPEINLMGYKLREILINPLVQKAEAWEHPIDLSGQNLREPDNLPFARLLITLNHLDASPFFDALRKILDEKIVKRQLRKSIAILDKNFASPVADTENMTGYDKMSKLFIENMTVLFAHNQVTLLPYEKALAGTLALKLKDGLIDSVLNTEEAEGIDPEKLKILAATGAKPFAGKLGFHTGVIRIMGNPHYSAKLEAEQVQAIVEEVIIRFSARRGFMLTHSEITKLSKMLTEIAQKTEVNDAGMDIVETQIIAASELQLKKWNDDVAKYALDLLFPSNNITEPMTLAKGIQSFISAIPTDKKADKTKAAEAATLINNMDTNLLKILETTDAKATTELYNSVKNDLKEALGIIKPISVPTDKLQTKTSLEGFMQASIDLMDNAQEGVTKDANLTAAYGA